MGTFDEHPLALFLVLTTISFLGQQLCLVHCKTHPSDIDVLRDLKNGLNPSSMPPGSCLRSWDFSLDPCDHIFTDRFTCGFRCDLNISGFSRVTEISLDQAAYSGSISSISSWNNLPYLQTLDLSFNSISGSIPESLSDLTRLRRLSLSRNSFTGSIPSSLSSLSSLEELYLDNNNLTGPVPASFSKLLSLKRLELQGNNLSGELPNLNQLASLYYLDLSDNAIHGKVASLFVPSNVVELSLRNNDLRDQFFSGNFIVSELKFLQVLDLSHNQLSGVIPSALYRHPSLEQLNLSHNRFTYLELPDDESGDISDQGSNKKKSKLVAIDLSYNKVHGLLPAFMGSMPKLSALSLEHNMFTGMIPVPYAQKAAGGGGGGGGVDGKTGSFERLLLGGNYLVGPIPGPLKRLKPGSVHVSLVDNCLYKCPDKYFFCQGGKQKSAWACKTFV